MEESIRQKTKNFVQFMIDKKLLKKEAIKNEDLFRLIEKIREMNYIKVLICYGKNVAALYKYYLNWCVENK